MAGVHPQPRAIQTTMLTIRCTKKLQTRLKVQADPNPSPSNNRLGDWYANLLYVKRQQLVLAVCERTLLPVLFPVKGKEPIREKLIQAVGDTLRALSLEESSIEEELEAMADGSVAKTASRQVLGSMTDFAFLLDALFESGASLLDLSLRLAEAPCSPLDMDNPRDVTIEVFKASGGHLRVVRS